MMTKPIYDCILKFIIIGESSVGKSNILSQFTDKRYLKSHDLTIGVEFATKIVSRQKTVYKLQIWDTAGQETFRALVRAYYRGTVGCLLVYDITTRSTFESLVYWLEELRSHVQNVSIALVGNKIDLEANREVSFEEGKEFAEKNNLIFFETSAKTAENIDATFSYLIDHINSKIENGELNIAKNKSSVKINTDNQPSWTCGC